MKRWYILAILMCTLLSGSPLLTAAALPEGISVTRDGMGYLVTFSLPEYRQTHVRADGGDYIHLTVPDYGMTSEVGLPALPIVSFNLMIAPEESGVITSAAGQVTESEFLSNKIYPAQEPWPKSRPISERPFRIDRAFYNSQGRTGQVLVSVSDPFIMAGARGVTVTISPFSYNPSRNEIVAVRQANIHLGLRFAPRAEGRFTRTLSELLKSTFVNFEAHTVLGNGNYLIITAPEFESTLAGFVSFKQSGGYPVYVANTTVTGTTNTAIKSYIQQRYNNPDTRPEFILLVGDVDRIPEWIGSTTDNPHTDLFYTHLDGTDYYPDAAIGRFSVSNTTELQNVINKTIFMENSINSLPKKNVFLASEDNYLISEGTHNAVIDTFFQPHAYTSLKRYSHTYGATTQQVLDDLNNNQTFAIYSGHGSETGWADGPPVTQAQVRSLVNTVFPYVYSFACLTGSFETSECFGETWIRIPTGGSAFWGSSVTSYWDEDDILERRLIHAMFTDTLIQSGPMFNRAKSYLAAYYGGFTETVKRYFEMYNLLGDPSIHTAQYTTNFGWVHGTITNQSGGAGVAGVSVDFADSINQQGATSNATGFYLAGARVDTPGTTRNVTLRARKFGFRDTLLSITLTRNDTLTLNFTLAPVPNGTLVVRTVRKDSSNIGSGITVLFNGGAVASGTTDSLTGIFSTILPLGNYDVLIDPPSPYGNRRFNNVVVATGSNPLYVVVRAVVENSPAAMRDTLAVGQLHTKSMLLTNTTTSDTVSFRLSDDNALMKARFSRPAVQPRAVPITLPQRPKGAPDTEFGTRPTGSGGPDAFGYRWIDSDDPGGPAYNWVEINSVGTPVTTWSGSTDDGSFSTTLPWPFPFYGNSYNTFFFTTNGWLGFNAPSTEYSNVAIPNTGEPNNAIYAWWDDLQAVGTSGYGTVYYYNDAANSRYVVEYNNVRHLSATSDTLKFEVILKPTGEILMQYSRMVSTSNLTSATIGIENADGSVGLQVVYNAAYIHNNLAIRYYLPDATWLSENPYVGRINPGATQNITVTFDAGTLQPGTIYNGKIVMDVVHPDVTGSIIIPASLKVNVATTPVIILSRTSIAFPSIEIGAQKVDSLTLRNGGSPTLVVSSIASTNPRFVPVPTSANITPGDSIRVRVTYSGTSPAHSDTGRIIILSNDPLTPRTDVILTGSSYGVSHILVRPDSLTFSRQPTADTTFSSFKIFNTGTDTLRYSIRESNASPVREARAIERSKQQQHSVAVSKGGIDPNPGQGGTDGQGGPDAFGYRWIDSDEPGGPVYNWIDISTVGTQITAWTGTADDGYASIPLPFTFLFYGTPFSGTINVCTNGFLSFTSTMNSYTNLAIPSTSAPLNGLFPWWDDQDMSASGSVYYYHDAANNQFIVEYLNVPHYSSGGPYTYEVILRPDGRILFQYQSMDPASLSSSTIGVQNGDGSVGLQVVYNAAYMHGNLALLITSDILPWMSTNPTQGTIAPGDSQAVSLRIHPAGLAAGTYVGYQRITGNTPDTTAKLKVRLSITTGVGEQQNPLPTEYSLSQNYPNPFNPETAIRYQVAGFGLVALRVYDVLGREVAALVNDIKQPGTYTVRWNASGQASGVYFYRLEAGRFTAVKKLILLR